MTEKGADGAVSADGEADCEPPDPDVGRDLFDGDPGSALAHLYRGEIHRMRFWRERLDRTTNWAVVVIAALLTWAFSDPTHPHYILLMGGAALGVFMGIEARRYRGYDIWRSRVRSLQCNVWGPALDPGIDPPDDDWRERLGDDFCNPAMKVSTEEAVAHRLRRIYLPLVTVLLGAWVVRTTAFASDPWPASAAVGSIPGAVVVAAVALVYGSAFWVALRPRTWHAKGELRTEDLRGD